MTYHYDANAFDTDPLSFRLETSPAGMSIDSATGLISWTPTAPQLGKHAVDLLVSDGRGGTATQRWTVNVFSPSPNHPPAIISAPDLIATIGVPYVYDVNARDPEGSAVTYALVSAPAGATINATSG